MVLARVKVFVSILPYKSRQASDAEAYYASYIPLQMGTSAKWERIGIDLPSDSLVYRILAHDIREWIERQSVDTWKYYDIADTRPYLSIGFIGETYVLTSELETWFLLRWT